MVLHTSQVARALGTDADKLRRWCREGKFDDIPGLRWTQNGFQRQREFTEEWVVAVGRRIGVDANFAFMEED